MKKLKTIGTALTIIVSSYAPVKAQPPLFAGYNGSKYALESRVNQDRQITEIGKTFRNEIPVWGYLGTSFGDAKKPFYGIGPRVKIGRLHILPTIEGYNGNFTGVSGYSTLDLPKRWYLDLVPHLDRNLTYTGTEFTLHRDVKGVSLGASSATYNKRLKSINLMFGKYWKKCSTTGNFDPKNKTGKLSFQKNFR